ncbi:hybrid sensor histidine kinase/response regulator [Mesoterricola sediminis]|uniref:histidine kinase n=1 Tax=Mesoterricola sediminis TaxID=2927980 RepID=A0AA48GU24_9BACT|nr:ATP-binding protein [Mesoterricola sediminis]BDU77607.1 hypothetical protein METESE_25650 [Mesoterricola sediminis]
MPTPAGEDPSGQLGAEALAAWRGQLVDRLLKAGAVLGLATYLPCLYYAVRYGHAAVAAGDTLALAWITAAAFHPGWSYRAKAGGLLAMVYGVAALLLVELGTFATGPLWLGVVPVLAALLWGLRASVACGILAAATYAAAGVAAAHGLLPSPAAPASGVAWLIIGVNGLFLAALLSMSASYLLKGLLRREERFARVFQLSPEAIAFSRLADDRFLDLNPAWTRTFGWSREEALGRTTEELGLWPAGADRASLRAEVEATGGLAPRRLELVRKDGTLATAMLTARAVDLDGGPCLLVLCQDLTAGLEAERERERLQAELLHAQKLESLGSLAGGVAHDMNNILASVVAVASTLREVREGDAAITRPLDLLLSAAERGRKLVRTLTDFSRKGLGDARPVDLNALVRTQAEILRGTSFARVAVVEALDADLQPVAGEPDSLANALMNLCVNALDAMPAGGTLTLSTGKGAGGGAFLAVADTGSGMRPEVLRRAMEPFFTTKPAGKGTGLGLAGVYGTMKAHGGTVDLESREGEGTRVTLRFPAAGPREASEGPRAESPAADGGAGLRVLLVDDDPIILDTLPAMLAQIGHDCAWVNGGPEALAKLDAGLVPDLVILDNNMPGMGGVETLAAIRSRHPVLPVLMATGYVEPALEVAAGEDPFVWLQEKPFTLADIRRKIGEIRAAASGRPC